MAQRASNRHGTPASEGGIWSSDAEHFDWSSVLPVSRPREIRRVGSIRSWAPRKNFGIVVDEGGTGDASFSMEDVAPSDRHRIEPGVTVSYIAVIGQDGTSARHLRIDNTTLPPPPPDTFILKGWR